MKRELKVLRDPVHDQFADVRAAERAARADSQSANRHLYDVLDRVSDGLVALDTNWHYTYVNRQAAGLFGRRPADLIGRHIWTEFPEGVGQPFHLAYEKALAEQVFIHMENYYEPWDRWFENRIYPSPEGLSIFFHDITDRKRAELLAQRTADLLQLQNRLLVEAERLAELGSYEWDCATNVVYRSEELCRIFGLEGGEFEPTLDGYLERVHPDDREQTRATIERSFHDGAPFAFEERIVRPDGSTRLLHSRGRWVLDSNGRPARLVGMCQDITERRRAEEQIHHAERLRNKNEELKAFAYTVSHDLKAPLRGIAGYARELERRHTSCLDERGRFCVGQILSATHNLDRLIEDLLHYSRVDAETPTSIDVQLPQLIDAILRDRNAMIQEHRAEVTIDVPPITIRTWESGLLQVLSNLIDNAIKYSRDSKPSRIHITAEEQPDRVRVAIGDNGIGFDMKYRDRIFGLFNRLVRQEQFEGTGAGLAIAKKVMDKLGGGLDAESTAAVGTTFFVDLPRNSPAKTIQ